MSVPLINCTCGGEPEVFMRETPDLYRQYFVRCTKCKKESKGHNMLFYAKRKWNQMNGGKQNERQAENSR